MNAKTIGRLCLYFRPEVGHISRVLETVEYFFRSGKKRKYEGHAQYFKGSAQWCLVVEQKIAIAAAGTKPHAIMGLCILIYQGESTPEGFSSCTYGQCIYTPVDEHCPRACLPASEFWLNVSSMTTGKLFNLSALAFLFVIMVPTHLIQLLWGLNELCLA